MKTKDEVRSLMDIDAYTKPQVAEIAGSLMEKLSLRGWNDLPVDEQVQLRLLKTLLDGWK